MMNPFRDRPRILARSAAVLTLWAAFSLISALVLTGCGSEPSPVALPKEPLHPARGKVVTAEDRPLTEGLVTFVPVRPNAREANGEIGPDGSFTVKTGDQGEGLAEGEYKVKIESNLTVPGVKPGSARAVVPVEYRDEHSSHLTATIKSGSNDLAPFKLVPVPRNAKKVLARGSAALRDN
jgi:hypothetical protein